MHMSKSIARYIDAAQDAGTYGLCPMQRMENVLPRGPYDPATGVVNDLTAVPATGTHKAPGNAR